MYSKVKNDPVYYVSLTNDTKENSCYTLFFFLALFSLSLDFSNIRCIMVLLHSLIYLASVLSAVECLVYASLKAHYICLLIIILLSSLSVAQVNVLGVCFWPIFRRHRNYLF